MKTKTIEKIFDAMLDEAAAQYVDDMNEQLDFSPIDFSAQHRRKMNRMFKKEQRKENIVSFTKIARRAACILLIAAVCSLAAVGSVVAWRDKVLKYVFNPDSPGTIFGFGESATDGYYSQWGIHLKYIPDGFELKEDDSANNLSLYFVNNKDEYFVVNSHPEKGKLGVDTENATIEEMVINGNNAIYTSNENGNSIIWFDTKHTYTIYGNIAQKELLKIVKNIEITKN